MKCKLLLQFSIIWFLQWIIAARPAKSDKVFRAGITAEASLVGLLETGHDQQVPPSERITMTRHLAGDSTANRVPRILALVVRMFGFFSSDLWQCSRPGSHSLSWWISSGALVSSNSFSLRFCTKSRSTFLEVLWNDFLAARRSHLHAARWSNHKNPQGARLDIWFGHETSTWHLLIGLSEVRNWVDSASHRTVPTAHRSNSVTLRDSRLITVSQLRWVENAYNFVHFVKIESRTSASRKIDGKRLLRRLGLDLFMATTYFSTEKN